MGVHATRNQLLYMHTHTTEACVLPEGYLASSGRGRAVLGEIALWPRASRAVLGEIALWPRASRDTTGVLSSIVMAVGMAIETWPSAVAGVLPGGRPSPLPRLSTQVLLKRREEPIADLDADGGDVITVITLLLAPLGRSCLDELRDRLLMRAHTPIRPVGAQSRPSGRQASERARKGRTARASPIPRLPLMSWGGQAGALGGAPVRKGSSARGRGRVHTTVNSQRGGFAAGECTPSSPC